MLTVTDVGSGLIVTTKVTEQGWDKGLLGPLVDKMEIDRPGKREGTHGQFFHTLSRVGLRSNTKHQTPNTVFTDN